MTVPEAKLFAYHIGIVVHSRDEATKRYTELLGVPEWHLSEIERQGLPNNPKTRGGKGVLHIAFGRAPGITLEIIEPEGQIAHKVWLDEHGEGVQHIGVWTPDVHAALREAVAKGCRVTHGALAQDAATIEVTPDSAPDAIVPYLNNMGYADPGLGGFQIEFIAAVNPERHRNMFSEIKDETIPLPPWYKPS
jgi:catechol 2,3-dioxygenase-like lactoylglutathione lyase family enzyme